MRMGTSLGYPMRIELMIADSQPAVLPLNYGHHKQQEQGPYPAFSVQGLQEPPYALSGFHRFHDGYTLTI